jgi:Family of unknown function (DUF5995)
MPLDRSIVERPYETVDDVIRGLTHLEQVFRDISDRRGIFVTAYILITEEIQRRIQRRQFENPEWVGRYAVSFANLYRIALIGYETGPPVDISKAWRVSFQTSAQGTGLVIEDLILGINAHINHDLPIALNEVSISEEREQKHRDHSAINDALKFAIAPVRSRIEMLYAPGLSLFDEILDPLEVEITSFSFEKARENAWIQGVGLANARNEQEQKYGLAAIDERAGVLASLIIAPTSDQPLLVAVIRHIEQAKPWWQYVGLPAIRATTLETTKPREMAIAKVTSTFPLPEVHTLEEVIATLGHLVSFYDSQRNRLSIYPTVYRRITQKVKESVEKGDFSDAEWMARLDVSFANRYFQTLNANNTGNVVPDCWATAFRAIADHKTTIIQDILLQINPRVNYDLPLALVEAGLETNIEARWADYERTYAFFMEEFDATKELLARKYTELLKVEMLDALLSHFDRELANFEYTRARQEAWDNAKHLLTEPSQTNRQLFVTQLDSKTTTLSRAVLLTGFPPAQWLGHILRSVEDLFSGTWSDFVEV